MAKVFVVHPTKDDLSAATQFGDLVYINQRYCFPDELVDGGIPVNFNVNLNDACDNFDPEFDYLMLAGDHLQVAAMCAGLGRYEEFRVLRFDRQANGYIPVRIEA